MTPSVQFEPADVCAETTAAYAYVPKEGERVLIAAYTPDVYGEIDAANGWFDAEHETQSGIHDAQVAALQHAIRYVFESAQLDTLRGVESALGKFMTLVQWAGLSLPSDVQVPLGSPKDNKLVVEVLKNCCAGVTQWTQKSKLRAYTRWLCTTWLVRPRVLTAEPGSGKTLSLESLAKPMGYTRCWLSMVAEEIGNHYGIHSRNQKRKSSRINYSKATKAAWELRKKSFAELMSSE